MCPPSEKSGRSGRSGRSGKTDAKGTKTGATAGAKTSTKTARTSARTARSAKTSARTARATAKTSAKASAKSRFQVQRAWELLPKQPPDRTQVRLEAQRDLGLLRSARPIRQQSPRGLRHMTVQRAVTTHMQAKLREARLM